MYKPNHHLFYTFRKEGVNLNDGLPKWDTLPEGKCDPPSLLGRVRVRFRIEFGLGGELGFGLG